MSEELKPCPFCGGEGEYVIGNSSALSLGGPWAPHIRCKSCGAKAFSDTEHAKPYYRAIARWNARPLLAPATDAGEVRTYREGVEAAAKVCAEWSTMLSMRVDDLIRIRAPQRTVKAIREAANQVLNVEAAIRKLP
jgi:hypothetical protein